MGFPRDVSPVRRRRVVPVATAFALLCMVWLFKIYSPVTLPISLSRPEKVQVGNPQIAPLISKNVAAIVEGRPIAMLAPLLLHFSSVLGHKWPIFVFTHANATMPDSAAFRRALEAKRINIIDLPAETDFKNRDAVSDFFTSPWFWEQLAPARHVLLFQSDSIICSNAPLSVNDFLQYDFVGAPINPNLGFGDEGMNGGLSLRNRTLFLETTQTHSWKDDLAFAVNPLDPKIKYEDQWFFHRLRDTINNTDGSYEARLPTPEQAGKFSIETLSFKGGRPFGYHQAARFQHDDDLKVMEKYCPEYRLATTEIINS